MGPLNFSSIVNRTPPLVQYCTKKLLNWLIEIITPILFIITVSIAFVSAYWADILVLQIIDWAFYDDVKKDTTTKLILGLVKSLSLNGTITAFILTLIFLLILLLVVAIRASLNLPGKAKGRELENLKLTAKKLQKDTIGTLKNIIKFTFIFAFTIGVVKLLLLVVRGESPIFVAITAIVTTTYYVSTLAISLIGYGWDLVKMVPEL